MSTSKVTNSSTNPHFISRDNINVTSKAEAMREVRNPGKRFVNYTVGEDTTLYRLAEEIYGDGSLYVYILKANLGLGNGYKIKKGTELVLPTKEEIERMKAMEKAQERPVDESKVPLPPDVADKYKKGSDGRAEALIAPGVYADRNGNICLGTLDEEGNCKGKVLGPATPGVTYSSVRQNSISEKHKYIAHLIDTLKKLEENPNMSFEEIDELIRNLDHESFWDKLLGNRGKYLEWDCRNFIRNIRKEMHISTQDAFRLWLYYKINELKSRLH